MLLSNMKENQIATISKIDSKCTLSRRLFDLGFIEGQKITCTNIGLTGSPIAYNICGCKLALRKKDAAMIGVII